MRVVFVCLGNICRSPTAEAVFAARVLAAGWAGRVHVDSAGLIDHHVGDLPDPRTRRCAEGRGLTLTHRARQFVIDDFHRFDYVIGMDLANMTRLQAMARTVEFSGVLARFRDFDPASPPGSDVPDPYHGDLAVFEQVYDLCDAAAAGLMATIAARLGA
jgi:protein-tyrosine phosphatase